MRSRIIALAVLWAACCGSAGALSIAIDQSFGDQGLVVFPAEAGQRYSLSAISTLRDGGVAVVYTDYDSVFISRLSYDGRFDSRFGVNGTVRVLVRELWFLPDKLMEDSSGRLIAIRGHLDGVLMARFNSDGRLDASFGTGGVGSISSPSAGAATCPGAIRVQEVHEQSDGRILVFGTRSASSEYILNYQWHCIFASRIDATGAADQTFGTAGVTQTPVLGMARLSGAKIRADGSLELSGVAKTVTHPGVHWEYPWQAAILHLDSEGKPIPAESPQLSFALPGDVATLRGGIVMQNRQSIFPAHTADQVTIRAFGPDGAQDVTFGGSGLVEIASAPTGFYPSYARMADGGLVAIGSADGSLESELLICVWRYSGRPIEGMPSNCSAIALGGIVTYENPDYYLSPGDALYYAGNRSAAGFASQLVLFRIDLSSPIVEFYHSGLKHYFMTPDGFEADALDRGGAGGGWSRTGVSFYAGGPSPMCRFYGTPGIGPNSHFYTADAAECAGVKRDRGWLYEGLAFSATTAPGGRCRSGLRPIHRLYNNRAEVNDSNHRHIADFGLVPSMQAQGWIYEGVAFCAR
jgi:uncharacterized delta-60 repeat protein